MGSPLARIINYRSYFVGVAIVSTILLVLWYPNRTICETDDYWGETCVGLRWGKGVKLTIDRDRNGKPEVVAIFSGESGHDALYGHAVPKEQWEDWDNDGQFERHYTYYDEQELDTLQLDTDGDGSYDKEMLGEEAREYLKANPWPGV